MVGNSEVTRFLGSVLVEITKDNRRSLGFAALRSATVWIVKCGLDELKREKAKRILRLPPPNLCPKEHKSLFGGSGKTSGAPFTQNDSAGYEAGCITEVI